MAGMCHPIWDRWDELDPLLAELLDLDPSERSRRSAVLCADDEELERTLRTLLHASDSGRPLDPGADLLAAAFSGDAPSDGSTEEPERVGPYRIIERLGRGGMGSVYLAERDDPDFPQRVAIKLLRRGVDTEDVVGRFVAERQILASLHHPGIATVFDAGATADGRPYLVMEHVRGRTITAHCDARGLDLPSRLRLFTAVARALAHAHEKGVVHRDLKPSNILVTEEEGHVKLLDFGIAKILGPEEGADAPRTAPGMRLLTLGYASPEQVLGLPITPRSDVYQLGILLCELLTGRRPFDRLSPRQYERSIASLEPEAPSRLVRSGAGERSAAERRGLARSLAGDLDAIVLRALRPDPEDRYPSALELNEDVLRFLSGSPVQARRGAFGYALGRSVRRNLRRAALPALGAAAGGLVLLAFVDSPGAERPPDDFPWIATAAIADETGNSASRLADQVSELLATSLARFPSVQVVRLHHLVPAGTPDASHLEAARHAGAREVLHGAIRNPAPGELELVLRRTNAGTGQVVDSVRARGSDSFELVDRASGLLLDQLRIVLPPRSAAGVAAVDPEAYRLYVEGLSAFRTGDDRVADRFFRAALAQDSTFAMAAYHAFAASGGDRDERLRLLNRARRLAESASERERLVIHARWADYMHDPTAPALADSLATRFPADPDGHYLRGRALYVSGDFLAAVPHLERAIRLDSLSLHADHAPCVACDALHTLQFAYARADSLAAAERVARRWVRLQPGSARAWYRLAAYLLHSGRHEEALTAAGRAASLRVGAIADALFPALAAIHAGDYAEADAILGRQARSGSTSVRREALWWLGISLRQQGRLAEALRVTERFHHASRPETENGWWDLPARSLRAQILFEMGRYGEAAETFANARRPYVEYSPSRQARHDVWLMTHEGTARAAAGDTARLVVLVDSVATVGARSYYGRDQRLHHYLRALLGRARGAPESEVEAHLRAALFSVPGGYSRINLELGRSLLAQGRPAEAAAVVAPALRRSPESNGFYTTRTELQDLLARALEAAGDPEGAARYRQAVAAAWRNADAPFRSRLGDLGATLATVERGPQGW